MIEAAIGVGNGMERSAAARIDTLTSSLQVSPEDHHSFVIDDRETVEVTELPGVGDGDD
jgi:hypothetical protein